MTDLGLLDVAPLLSDEERDIQRTVRGFLAEHSRPRIADWFERAVGQATLTGRSAFR